MGQVINLLRSWRTRESLSERHRPSGVNARLQHQAGTIAEFLLESREKVESARVDLDGEQREWIIAGNSAFELKPDSPVKPRRGILMVHGLTDSPFMFTDLAGYFRQQGFHVLVIPLPGHGTRPGDMLEIRWRDWWQAHQHAVDLLSAEVDEIYLCGFSAGAVLNIYQALQDKRIRALFLFAPALRIRPMARLGCPLAALGRHLPHLAWFDLQPDSDYFKYESITWRSVCEVYRMIEALNRLLTIGELGIPVFVAASEDDKTIDAQAIVEWFTSLRTQKQMLYYTAGHLPVPADVKRIHSQFPQQKIKSFAHTALLASADNRHYGAQGSYRFCTHYHRLAPDKYQRCKAGLEDCLGEMFDETPDCQVVRRLTYNPLFEPMLDDISAFLDRIEAEEES